MNSESKSKISVLAAAFLAVSGLSVLPAVAQLPPTNMGKFVHKPGDNQYSDATQSTRHPAAPPPIISRPMGGGGGGGGGGSMGYTPTRPKPKPDISLQAIPADEPIAPAGFPPLPESVDLPGINMVTALNAGGYSGAGGGGGGGGGGGANSPNPFQGTKQGYAHYTPGAFSDQKRPGSTPSKVRVDSAPEMHQHYMHVQPGSLSSGGGGQGGSPGYYKARTPAPPKEDTFGAKDTSSGPNYGAALKKLGREPKLNDRVYGTESAAPEAPVPVQINQASTQDLSLPDDDFEARRPPSKAGRYMGRQLKQFGMRARSGINQLPIPMRIPTGR